MAVQSKNYRRQFAHGQRGAVLFVGLVMLLIVTLVGVSSMTSVTLDEKVVSSMQSSTMAYYGAESALANCETALQAEQVDAFYVGSIAQSLGSSWQSNPAVWSHANVKEVDFSGASSGGVDTGLNARAKCLAEFIGDGGSDLDVKKFYRGTDNPASRLAYRVTSWSNGGDAKVEAVMESLFVCSVGCSDEAESY